MALAMASSEAILQGPTVAVRCSDSSASFASPSIGLATEEASNLLDYALTRFLSGIWTNDHGDGTAIGPVVGAVDRLTEVSVRRVI